MKTYIWLVTTSNTFSSYFLHFLLERPTMFTLVMCLPYFDMWCHPPVKYCFNCSKFLNDFRFLNRGTNFFTSFSIFIVSFCIFILYKIFFIYIQKLFFNYFTIYYLYHNFIQVFSFHCFITVDCPCNNINNNNVL